jgi:tellurite resistance protein TehA-like permease
MNMLTVILLGVLGSVISAVIGTLWYSTKTPMGKIHLESRGLHKFSEEEQIQEMKPKMWKYLLTQILLSFLTSIFIAFIMIAQKAYDVGTVVIYGEVASVWLCFVMPTIGQALLWGNYDSKLRWKKFFSDSLSNLVTLLVIVFVFSLII